jgi:predicted metal-dependent phosphoesterase TrpH
VREADAGAATGRLVDLHLHSTASDGLASPAAVVERAIALNLAAIALTDHDTMDGVAGARAAACGSELRVVPGVELSAFDGDQEIHLLGLHVAHPEMIEDALRSYREGRVERAQHIVARLHSLGIPVAFDAVLAAAAGGAVGRPHIARALVAGGWVRDLHDAFDRLLGAGRPAFVEKRRLALADAIALVRSAGGLAIYAHPGRDATKRRIEALSALGLDGVEVRHPSHSSEDAARIGAIVDALGLVPSGGSDCHGATDGSRAMGSMRVPAAWLDLHAARIARRTGSCAA